MKGKCWKAGILVACMAFFQMGCTRLELKHHIFEVELGADVFANPRLYVIDGDALQVDKASVYALSTGVVKKDNRFFSADSQFLNAGEYDFMLEYDGAEYPFIIKVSDTQPPMCNKSPGYMDAKLNETIDWAQVFDARDLSGVYYEGPTDLTSQVGSFEANVKVYDRYGNAVTKKIMVNVG